MSTERPLILNEYKGKSSLEILFQKFGYDEDNLRFYQAGLEQANQTLSLNEPRAASPYITQAGEEEPLGANNIYRIAFGTKQEKGQWTDQPAIILFVARKAALEKVEEAYQAATIGERFFHGQFTTDVYELKVEWNNPQPPIPTRKKRLSIDT